MEENRDELQFQKAMRASELILKYLHEELSDLDQKELDLWVEETNLNHQTFTELSNPDSLNASLQELARFESAKKKSFERICAIADDGERKNEVGRVKS